MAEERDRWSSRAAFILASMGAAIGFGNVWRFPALAYEYGGGAFFIPYLLALFFIGIPLLVLEFAMGQYYQAGHVGSFGKIHRSLRGIGIAAVLNGFFIVVYYTMLIGWVVNGFFQSAKTSVDWESMDGGEAITYFLTDVMCMPTADYVGRPNRLCWDNFGYLALCWVFILLSLVFGLKWTGRIAYFTMGLPIVLLFVFLGRAVSLPGSQDGIRAYMGEWDMSVLVDQPDVWSKAVSQIFFSIGVTFGIMTAFGSHLERDAPAFSNGCIVACCNSIFSILAGLAVFGSVGYLADQEGVAIDELTVGGLGLVFGTWPVVLATLPGGEHWVRLLFFNLFLLGIDSAFALMEAALSICKDSVILGKYSHRTLTVAGCFIGFICGIMYATDAGLLLLDAVDYYINYIMIVLGFFESFSGGWVYKIEDQVKTFGRNTIISFITATFGSVILASGLWFGLGSIWAGFVGLVVFYSIGMAVTLSMCKHLVADGERSWGSVVYELYMQNVLDFRTDLSDVVGYIPVVWAVLIKHFIPQILLILFANLSSNKNDDGRNVFGNYAGYPNWPYQVLGIVIVVLTILLVLIGFALPNFYDPIDVPKEVAEQQVKELGLDEKPSDAVEDSTGQEKALEADEVA